MKANCRSTNVFRNVRFAFAGILSAVVVVLLWNFSPLHGAVSSGPVADNNDPDLPSIFSGQSIDKQEYLRKRAEYFDSLRGIEPGEAFDPLARVRAILQMQTQQADVLNVLKASPNSAKPGSTENGELAIQNLSWTELGPAPIPNGQSFGFPTHVSGRVTAIAVHPTNPNIAYVGTAQGGLYRTLDGGVTWMPLMDNAQSLAIGAVAIAPSDPSIVYVGTGEANLSADSFFGVGLYRINSAGGSSPLLTGPINPPVATGIPGTTAFTGRAISKIVVHPTDPGTIFVATASGISGNPYDFLDMSVPPMALRGLYRSTNATADLNSIAFQKLTVTTAGSVAPDMTGNRSVMDVIMEPGVPDHLICAVLGGTDSSAPDGGIYISSNALAASPVFSETLSLDSARGQLAINKTAAVVTVYLAADEYDPDDPVGVTCAASSGTLRKSLDGGNTWTQPLPNADGFCGGQCWYDMSLAVDPTNALNVLLGGSAHYFNGDCSVAIERSTDGGVTYNSVSNGVHADNHVAAFAPSDPTIAYMGTDGGIYKSIDSGQIWFSLSNATFRATQFQSLATHPTDREFMIGGTQDNGTEKRFPNSSWFRVDYGDGGYALIDQNATDTTNVTMYHTYFNATNNLIGWVHSADAGASWDGFNCDFGFGADENNGISCDDTVLFYAPMALGPGNPNTLYFGTDRLYRSTDGLHMILVSQGPLAMDSVPPAQPANQPVTTIAISPQDDNVRLVGLRDAKVFATTTGSTTLTDVTSATFPPPNAGSIRRAVSRAVFDPNDRKTAYITFGGYNVPDGQHVWKTTNLDTSNGASPVVWMPAGNGIPDVPVDCIVVDRTNTNNLYVGTDIGVYRSTDAGASWAPFSNGLPRVAVFDIAFQEQRTSTSTDRVIRIATHGRGVWEITVPTSTPTPTPTPTVTPTATATPTSTATPSPIPTASPTPTATPTATPTPTPTATPSPTPTPSPTATPTATPTPTPGTTPTVTVSASPAQISRGSDATFIVSASIAASQDTTVGYAMSGKAALGSDYTLSGNPGQVTIAAGQTSGIVMLHALTNSGAKKKETAIMTLQPGSGYQFASAGTKKKKAKAPSATVTITP